MAREVNFVNGTVVAATFLNDQQEVKSALHVGVRLVAASATQIELPPLDDGNDGVTGQSSIIINGQPRWWNSSIVKTVSGAKGTYSIYVVAGESNPLTSAAITITTEAAPANSRKIGEVDWSGTAIEAIRQTLGQVTVAMLDPSVVRKFTQTIGDGATKVFTIEHKLNTRAINVVVRQAAEPWKEIFVGFITEANGLNTVKMTFTTAPTAGQYVVSVFG